MSKKIFLILVIVIIIFLFLFFFVFKDKFDFNKLITNIKPNNILTTQSYNYITTGSYHKGNFVYGGAMQLAINDLNENILHEKLQLKLDDSDTDTKRILNIFNKSEFTKDDLDDKSYYVKSGYGQKTIDLINREWKQKFRDKSFSDLSTQLDPTDIISFAYFLKEIEYKTPFDKDEMRFLGIYVESFRAKSNEQKENVEIVEYKDDDNFIVSLKLKDNSDEIFLVKGYSQNDPNLVIKKIIKGNKTKEIMAKNDTFAAPMINLDFTRAYKGFINKSLTNKKFIEYFITDMYEKIKFDMDEKGARVENMAGMMMNMSAFPGEVVKYKNLILDKPYWIIMKRRDSNNPYFVLMVNNTNIMKTK